MNPNTQPVSLNQLSMLPYLNEQGLISPEWQGKIGVYAIFDADQILRYVGYSRDIYLSLRQHLARQPQACHGLKAQCSDRPSRTLLGGICQQWIAENGTCPAGNGEQSHLWTQAINVRSRMTDSEQQRFQNTDEQGQSQLLKTVARRIEAEIQSHLQALGINEDLRFNPKLKEQGLLDLK